MGDVGDSFAVLLPNRHVLVLGNSGEFYEFDGKKLTSVRRLDCSFCPLVVRIMNQKTGHVFYARTHDHSTMGVATGSALVSTNSDVPQLWRREQVRCR
jgi:hypothetical protein